MPPGYCKVIGSWNILRPITRAFPRSIPINHPPCSIKGKVPMFGARNTNFCEASMCSLERCAGACLSVRKQLQNWGFAPTLSLLMWQKTWGQKDFTGSPLGAKVARKKIFKARQNQLFGLIYFEKKQKTLSSNSKYREIFSYWKIPFWIIMVRWHIQLSSMDTAV